MQTKQISANFIGGLLVAFLLAGEAKAQTWTGKWIWSTVANRASKNEWVCFRKSVTLATVPASVTAKIAVDSKYWMWINGELAVFEGGLKRGPNRTDTYYDEVDIAKHLRPGTNTIAVLAWYWGRNGTSQNSSGQGGFLFDADLGGTKIFTDSTWKCLKHPAYDSTGGLNPNWRYAEYNIKFKAGLDIPGWELSGFNDAAWAKPVVFGAPPSAPWNVLWKRPIPEWKNSGLVDYPNKALFPSTATGDTIKARLPYNAQVTPYLKVDAPAGLTIHVQTDHYVDPDYDDNDRRSIRFEYVTKAGIQEYEFPAWSNGEEVWYRIPAGVKILDLKYRETGYNTAFAGSFICNDDFYNKLVEKSRRTLYVCMRDHYMDCPDRERTQWGDANISIHESFYAFDAASHALGRKAYREIISYQTDSAILIPAPAVRDNCEVPVQGLYTVGLHGIWNYYLHTGDIALVHESYAAIKKYLFLWSMGADGLIAHRTGTWDWTDWGENIDATALQNIWYYMALDAASRMAPLAGANADVPTYQARMNSIKTSFNNLYWKGTYYSSGTTPDDRTNALAVVAGLAESTKYGAISTILQTVKNASPWMEKFVLEALFKMNRPQEALTRMKSRYSQMVALPGTTLYEHWGLVGGTRNHAWTSGSLILLPQFTGGIEPLTPGYATYQVMPQMANLTSASASVASVKGQISVSIQNSASQFTMSLTSPTGTQAIVGVPKSASTALVAVNGKVIYQNGAYVGGVAGITFVGEDSRYYKFQAAPGAWTFYGGATPPSISGQRAQKSSLHLFAQAASGGMEISYSLANPCDVELALLDVSGRKIEVLDKGYREKGTYTSSRETRSHSSGLYVIRLRAGKQQEVVRQIKIR